MKSVFKGRILRALGQRTRIARVIVAVAFAGLFTAACKDSTSPRIVTALTISPTSPQTIAVNGTVQFTAVAKNADGDVLAVKPTWSIVSGGGTISSTGLFTAGTTPGTTVIAVTCSGITVNVTITVNAGAAATIAVLPQTVTLFPGGTQTFTAVVKDANGNILTVTPVWTVPNPPGTIISTTGAFTAGSTLGSFPNTVQACVGTLCDQADVIVIAGPLLTITVTPNPDTLLIGGVQTFTAVGRDASGNVVTINPSWSVTAGGGTIPAGTTGLTAPFTAGNTLGSFPNTVRATQGAIFGTATVVVIAPIVPPVAGFTILANAAVSCTNGSITGDVGTFEALGDAPPGSITQSICPISGGTAQVGTVASKQAYNDFVTTYNSLATAPCGVVLTGTLAGVTLPPGVYCFDAAAAPTGTLTLTGTSTDRWLFKIGTSGTGALTPGSFTVVMAGTSQACNVTWWVKQAATMTDSFFKGSVLAGAGITLIRGSFNGNAWSQADVTITGPLTTAVTGCP